MGGQDDWDSNFRTLQIINERQYSAPQNISDISPHSPTKKISAFHLICLPSLMISSLLCLGFHLFRAIQLINELYQSKYTLIYAIRWISVLAVILCSVPSSLGLCTRMLTHSRKNRVNEIILWPNLIILYFSVLEFFTDIDQDKALNELIFSTTTSEMLPPVASVTLFNLCIDGMTCLISCSIIVSLTHGIFDQFVPFFETMNSSNEKINQQSSHFKDLFTSLPKSVSTGWTLNSSISQATVGEANTSVYLAKLSGNNSKKQIGTMMRTMKDSTAAT